MTLDEIKFEVNVNFIEKRIEKFARYLDESEEDNFDYPAIYQAIVANNKANEPDTEVVTTKGTRRPGNRAERRKATEHKKNTLGRTRKYCTEGVYAYIVKKDANRKKTTRWIADIVKEEAWDEYDSIDWSKVKAVKTRNFGYKHGNKHPKLLGKSRHGKERIRDYDDFDFETAFSYYADDVYWSEIAPDDFDEIGNPWGYTEEEKRNIYQSHRHGDFSDDKLNFIIWADKLCNRHS